MNPLYVAARQQGDEPMPSLEKAVIGAERKPNNADEFNPTAPGFGNSCRATVDGFSGWNVVLEEQQYGRP